MTYLLVATAAFGLEAVVVRELKNLGYESHVVRPGRIEFAGDWSAICRANLWLRSADRVMVQLAKFPAPDFDALFDTIGALPWEEWIDRESSILVRGRSHKSQLTSVPAIQRTVKKAIVNRLIAQYRTTELPETGSPVPIEIALLDDEAMISVDTSGEGLHKRGYRSLAGPAQLRETLAAALVQLSFWQPDKPLIDPFCGTGTIIIEAAMIGRNLAPGRHREFAAERWSNSPPEAWRLARQEVADLALPGLDERPLGTDIDDESLSLARYHAEQADVAADVHFQQRAFIDLTSKRQFGCTIMNPPYGMRLGEEREIAELYRSFPEVLRRLKTWSHFILSARDDLEQLVGQEADRRRKLYNGRIQCTYFQFFGPKEHARTSEIVVAPPAPAFGGLREEASRQADEFANRLKKLARHLRRWPARGITCYRLYERDIPEVPLVVDRYEDALHIAEFERPHERTAAEHADWLDLMVRTAASALDVPREAVFLKHRERQRGDSQYERFSDEHAVRTVQEAGLKFLINLSDYLDTGLFLDHRITRGMVRDAAAGKRFLNLFAYTGSFTVYAAAGGAAVTTTVDLSGNYLEWAEENLRINGLAGSQHRFMREDSLEFVHALGRNDVFDLAVVDPPTFSNSKRLDYDWDVQRDHVVLLNKVIEHLAPGGVIYFSNNSRRFKLDEQSITSATIREISKQTVPEDFRNKRIHRCWRLIKQA